MSKHVTQYYDAPLKVKIERKAIVLRIGIRTLLQAMKYADWANPYDEARGEYARTFAVSDPKQFARDVVHEMLREREDGSTPLSDFLDKMTEEAVNQGSVGLHEDFDQHIQYGTCAPEEQW